MGECGYTDQSCHFKYRWPGQDLKPVLWALDSRSPLKIRKGPVLVLKDSKKKTLLGIQNLGSDFDFPIVLVIFLLLL